MDGYTIISNCSVLCVQMVFCDLGFSYYSFAIKRIESVVTILAMAGG